MANEAQWLVTYSEIPVEMDECATQEEAIDRIRGRLLAGKHDAVLWRRIAFGVHVNVAVGPRRRRTSSAGPAADAATPAASVPEKAAGPVDVSPAGTVRTTGARAIWCGGRACTDRAGVEVHRDDPSCLKLHPGKRAEAGR